jgi:protein SCO1/2
MKRSAIILATGFGLSALIVAGRWVVHPGSEPLQTPNQDLKKPIPQEAPGPAPLKPGEPIPDAALVTQDGRPVQISDFKGRALVLSFIYTRCNMTTMCPMATRKLKEAQKLARENQLDVQFLVVSFDPEDSPPVLRDYARLHEVDLSNWTFATGPGDEVLPLARRLSTYYQRSPGGAYEHNIAVAIVDPRGMYRDLFFGTDWDSKEFLRALREVNR